MAENFDVLINLLLNEQVKTKTVDGIKEVDKSIEDLGSDNLSSSGRLREVNKKLDEMGKGLDKLHQKRIDQKRAIEQERAALEKYNQVLTKQAGLLAKLSSQLTRFGTGAMVGGTVILGGLFAEANRYAKEAKNATAATIQWNAALASLATSRKRVDETITQTILPYLREASKIVDTASRFIQANPQIVSAALTVGASLVTIGALAKVLAVPIKLMSDRLYYTAQIAEIAALKENTAALLGKTALGNAGKGLLAGGTATAIGTGIALGAAVTGAAYVANKAGGGYQYGLGKGSGPRGYDPALKQTEYQEKLAASTNKASNSLDIFSKKTLGFNPPTPANTYNPAGTSGGRRYVSPYTKAEPGTLEYIGVSPQQEQTVLSIRQVDASLKELKTNYTATLTSITADFLKGQKQAETEYANQRSQVVREGSLEIQRIEQDHQRRLAKLALDHEDKMYSLTLQRDALGIVQEQRDYARARDEEESNTNLEIKRRRADIALKLADMAKQYKAERAMAVQQYQAQLNIEKQKYDAQQSVLVAQRNDLLLFLNDERTWRQRYNAAILADLQIYAAAWRATLASALGISTTTSHPMATPTVAGQVGHRRAMGGYADYGQYLLGDNPFGGRGPTEYVMNGKTTRAAEQMLGGSLTQGGLLAAIASGAGGGFHITDNSRYATTISASDRRAIRQGAVADMMTIVGAKK